MRCSWIGNLGSIVRFELLLVTGVLLCLVACNSQPTVGNGAVDVVQSYIQGQIAHDSNKLISLTCKDQETQAIIDADQFRSLDPKLSGMACQQIAADASDVVVACTGQITTEYTGESHVWQLSDYNFRVVQEDGQSKVCGHVSK